MRLFLPLCALLVAPLSALGTICVHVPLEERFEEADVAFLATVVSAQSSEDFGVLQTGDMYRVGYSFEIRERFKGDPAAVTSLFTGNTYHAHDSDLSIDGDETRLLPGDNVLVIANSPGEVQIASCTPSRVWSPSTEELRLLRSS